MAAKAKRRTSRKAKTPTSPDDPVTAYAEAVTAGNILAGPHVRGACRRHLEDLKSGPTRGLRWDVTAALRVIGYFRDILRLNGGDAEGEPFILLPWQQFIVGSLFGWKAPDGSRRFRKAFVETGKGSGKSPIAAGIGLYMQTADGEPRAEIYAAAAKKDQAKVLFKDAVAMVEQSPELAERLTMSGGQEKHNIAHLASGSFFRPISSESRGRGQSGPRPHCALLDEIHEHPSDAMVEFMVAGTKGRRQALIFMITNSGSDRTGVCYHYHDYGAKICSGALQDDAFFAYISSLDDGDDPFRDKTCWPKANPSLGVTIKEKYLEEQVTQAIGMPSKQNIVLRLNFCRWTDSDAAWIGREQWEQIERDVDIDEFRGRRCFAAIDLSGRLDLTALALAFLADDGTIDAAVEFWTPADTMEDRGQRDNVTYSQWARDRFLTAVPGKSIDYGFVANRIGEVDGLFDLQSLAYDRWRIDDLHRELSDAGVGAWKASEAATGSGIKLVEFGQGFKDMGPAVDDIEEAILNKKLRVRKNPVLYWNAASAVLEADPAGSRKFSKRRATGRIDGLVALAMAVRMAKQGAPAAGDFTIYFG